MCADRNFFYDFNQGALAAWTVVAAGERRQANAVDGIIPMSASAGETCRFHAEIEAAEDGDAVLCVSSGDKVDPLQFTLNDEPSEINWERSEIAYVESRNRFGQGGLKYAFRVRLRKGKNSLEIALRIQRDMTEISLLVNILRDTESRTSERVEPRVLSLDCLPRTDYVNVRETPWPPEGFEPGTGTLARTPGRFGFTKGDGVLDCAMPCLGVIDRMYLCGHPDYLKPFRWMFSILPPGIIPEEKYRGSFPPAIGLGEDDKIDVNHLSVKWQATFATQEDFFERKAGSRVPFSCTYSLASPGILVETSDPGLALDNLEYAGNYRCLLLPLEQGVTVRPVNANDTLYDIERDGKLKANWALLYGADEFPDIPLLLVFGRQPHTITAQHGSGKKLRGIRVHVPGGLGHAHIAAPFGIQAFTPGETQEDEFLKDAVKRCCFWSRALKAYPVACEEYYRLCAERQTVEIRQRFSYRLLRDEWNTEPLKTAPLPPVLSLLDGTGIVSDAEPEDYRFPTKYGFLRGAIGQSVSSYEIPCAPLRRRFPLMSKSAETVQQELADGMSEYIAFHDSFQPDELPYVCADGYVNKYAYPLTLFTFMRPETRRLLTEKAAEAVARAADPELQYQYLPTDFRTMMNNMPDRDEVRRIYSDPVKEEKKSFYGWYKRSEPFTGAEYRITLINVFVANAFTKADSKEDVAALTKPLIENDWGIGLALYGIYLTALVSGNWTPVKEHWRALKSAFGYMDLVHDWACMGPGYAEDGVTWVEGANYGAFPAFAAMAEAVGDRETADNATYAAAKNALLRMAVFRSSQKYFFRFFGHKPWWISKFLHEEASPAQAFTNVPELVDGVYRPEGMYNLTTEGMYPEVFTLFNQFLPDEFAEFRRVFRRTNADSFNGPKRSQPDKWQTMQEASSYLLSLVLDETTDSAEVLKEIKATERTGALMREWRGIHIPTRLLPPNWFKAYLKALVMTREHPVWLEFWHGLVITDGTYRQETRQAEIEVTCESGNGTLTLGAKETPIRAELNGCELPFSVDEQPAGMKIIIKIEQSGKLVLVFGADQEGTQETG